MGFASMTRDLNCTKFQAALGLSFFTIGFGLVPLVTASFSEEFGRRPVYIGSAIGFTSMFAMIALYVRFQMSTHQLDSVDVDIVPYRQIKKYRDCLSGAVNTRILCFNSRHNGGRNYF
jgi:MFS family permease